MTCDSSACYSAYMKNLFALLIFSFIYPPSFELHILKMWNKFWYWVLVFSVFFKREDGFEPIEHLDGASEDGRGSIARDGLKGFEERIFPKIQLLNGKWSVMKVSIVFQKQFEYIRSNESIKIKTRRNGENWNNNLYRIEEKENGKGLLTWRNHRTVT
jgi:hypothetical protein